MNDQTINVKTIIAIAGALIAFLIGSGFATGQEVLQYFASYGYKGIAGAVVTLILLLYVCVSFISAGQEYKFKKSGDIYIYYCGRFLGTFFDYFSTLFIYLSFIVMIAGAGATFYQHFDLPVFAGAVSMTFLTCMTVLLGLGRIVEIIGKIGPAIVVISITLGLISIFKNLDGIAESNQILPFLNLTKASTNWFFAACSYVGFCLLWLAGFLSSIGSTANNKKEAVYGAAAGAILFSIAVIIITLGLLACLQDVAGSQIPLLILAGKIHPQLATIFSFVILSGIYTTAVPLLWSVSSRFTQDKSTRFKLLTIILAVIGFIIALELPFAQFVNIVYGINGYVGMLLLALMVVKTIKNRIKKIDHRLIPPVSP
jgi:uncharacterized membrane protein YkvI